LRLAHLVDLTSGVVLTAVTGLVEISSSSGPN
jgi:hypothetical protein